MISVDAGLQNNFLLSLWPGQKSASILLSPDSLTPKSYFLRPETRLPQIKARNMMPFRLKPEISVSSVKPK